LFPLLDYLSDPESAPPKAILWYIYSVCCRENNRTCKNTK